MIVLGTFLGVSSYQSLKGLFPKDDPSSFKTCLIKDEIDKEVIDENPSN